MADLNTFVAYPYTRSNRPKDKIMSEVMIAQIVKNSIPSSIKNCWANDDKTQLILNGYYFETANDLASNTDKFVYCFIQKDSETQFPELLNWSSMTDTVNPDIDEYECLFVLDSEILSDNIPAPFTDILSYDSNGFYYGDHNYVDVCGGSIADIQDLKSLSKPFYISQTSIDTLRDKIWIKSDTMNPYVYDDSQSDWVPLGAVYKTTP